VKPTVLKQPSAPLGERIISEEISRHLRGMMRRVVTEGTARMGDVPGYSVAGKTGTADKPSPEGGYYSDKVLATFASFFPSTDPRYVLIVTLDEPEDRTGVEPRRTAGATAVPVAAEIIRRVAPLLGLAPEIEPTLQNGLTLANN
jgi:cell division protein FtsI (penicillin-binding protein 3)